VKVESNIQGVLDRLKRKPRDIRAALSRTLAPAEWDKPLREEAKRTLWALASPSRTGQNSSEWDFVDAFIDTIMVAPLLTGFFARLSNPLPPVLAVEDFMMARGLQIMALRRGAGPMLWSDILNQFDQMITDWVATEKRKDRRDWDKSDEDIGHFIGYLLLTPGANLSEKEKAAKDKLMPHLRDYLERRQKEKRLNSETINAWLLAVLAAWSALVRREFPGRFRGHLAAVRSEL
jgi:hypothetical protein